MNQENDGQEELNDNLEGAEGVIDDDNLHGDILDYESSIYTNHNQQFQPVHPMAHAHDMYTLDETIARRVEQERLDKIYHDSRSLKNSLARRQGRCEICTLLPPCRHNKEPVNQRDIIDEEPEGHGSQQQAGVRVAVEGVGGHTQREGTNAAAVNFFKPPRQSQTHRERSSHLDNELMEDSILSGSSRYQHDRYSYQLKQSSHQAGKSPQISPRRQQKAT